MLVIGTSATVYPAAEFPFEVLRRGGQADRGEPVRERADRGSPRSRSRARAARCCRAWSTTSKSAQRGRAGRDWRTTTAATAAVAASAGASAASCARCSRASPGASAPRRTRPCSSALAVGRRPARRQRQRQHARDRRGPRRHRGARRARWRAPSQRGRGASSSLERDPAARARGRRRRARDRASRCPGRWNRRGRADLEVHAPRARARRRGPPSNGRVCVTGLRARGALHTRATARSASTTWSATSTSPPRTRKVQHPLHLRPAAWRAPATARSSSRSTAARSTPPPRTA